MLKYGVPAAPCAPPSLTLKTIPFLTPVPNPYPSFPASNLPVKIKLFLPYIYALLVI
jgi:hypothetical protein